MSCTNKKHWLVLYLFITLLLTACANSDSGTPQTDPGGSQVVPVTESAIAIGGDAKVTISWEPLSDTVSYNIYWNKTGSVTSADNVTNNISSPYTHLGVSNNQWFYYLIEAVDAEGNSTFYKEISAKPNSIPPAPANFKAKANNGEVLLTWDRAARATSYNIFWNNSGAVTTADAVLENVKYPYFHRNLENDKTYYYIIVALNGAGASDTAPEISATPQRFLPAKPSNIQAYEGDNKFYLNWDKVENASAYNVYWANVSDGDIFANQIANVTPPYEFTDVIIGKSYYFAISAVNYAGEGHVDYANPVVAKAGSVYYVSELSGDDTADGLSPVNAKKTINAAIAIASAPAEIRVNAGMYTDTPVVMVEGVSLYGGYSADFSTRDSTNVSQIVDQGAIGTASISHALEAGAGISQFTVVDGFDISALSDGGSTRIAAVLIQNGGAPTLHNNVIHSGDSSNLTYAVNIDQSAPTLINNKIKSGNSADSAGINSTDASPLIENNLIEAGSGTNQSAGIYGYATTATIRNNVIFGGSGSPLSSGIEDRASLGSTIYNNMIHGGTGEDARGIFAFGASPLIRNNTISGGNGSIRSSGIWLESASGGDIGKTAIDNNNIFTDGDLRSACIANRDLYGNADSIRNNNLFTCHSLYRSYDPNNLPCVTCDLLQIPQLDYLGNYGASGNISVDPLFIDIDGTDNDILTMDDNNWRLSNATPISVKAGGLNGHNELGWHFDSDKDGRARPSAGNAWSIGAYEP